MTPTEQARRDALKLCIAALQSKWSPYVRAGAGDKEAAAMKAASAALSLPAAEPMTELEVIDAFCKEPNQTLYVAVFRAGVRCAEAHHGIGKWE